MAWTLLRKSIHDAKWLLAGCGLAMFAFCWLRVWVVSIVDTSRFEAILNLIPGDWQRFTPVEFSWLITHVGRISLAYDELIVVMCVSIWAIARGSDCVSGELGRGTLEMLLAQPLGRLKFLSTHAAVTIAGTGLLASAAWAGTFAGIQATTVKEYKTATIRVPLIEGGVPLPFAERRLVHVPMAERVDHRLFWPASLNLFALGCMLSGFSTAVSSWDRYRWRTLGIVVGVYIVELIIKIAGLAADDLSWLLYFSIFTAYEPEAFVQVADTTPQFAWSLFTQSEAGQREYGPLWYDSVLGSVAAGCYLIAAVVFVRRDLPAPL